MTTGSSGVSRRSRRRSCSSGAANTGCGRRRAISGERRGSRGRGADRSPGLQRRRCPANSSPIRRGRCWTARSSMVARALGDKRDSVGSGDSQRSGIACAPSCYPLSPDHYPLPHIQDRISRPVANASNGSLIEAFSCGSQICSISIASASRSTTPTAEVDRRAPLAQHPHERAAQEQLAEQLRPIDGPRSASARPISNHATNGHRSKSCARLR